MRTTLDITDEILRAAKKQAADRGVPLREVGEEALRTHLARRSRPVDYRFRWNPQTGRLRPGVNLDDRDSLFDRLEGRD